jgi:hypothetical protein
MYLQKSQLLMVLWKCMEWCTVKIWQVNQVSKMIYNNLKVSLLKKILIKQNLLH